MVLPSTKFQQGRFRPRNPSKYKGDPTNIIYRSSWELKLLHYLDSHPDVIQYASEEFPIPYLHPIDDRVHKYFPDFWVKHRLKDGTIQTTVIEVKPKKQTVEPPIPKKGITRNYKREKITYAINKAKWQAAEHFCEQRNWKFQILTEDTLGLG